MRTRKPTRIPPPSPPSSEPPKGPLHGMTPVGSHGMSVGYGLDAQEAPPLTDEQRTMWNTVVPNPEIPIAEYLEHEKALQEYEGKKLNRLEIMTWAQRTRARFLSLSMADRKIFLDVLTADEGGAMSRMFSLQAQLESQGVDDNQLKLTKTMTKALRPGGHVNDAIAPIRKALRGQKQAEQRKQKMLTAGSRAALPPGRALALPGGKS